MDFGRQLADLLQGSDSEQTTAPDKRIAKFIEQERLRRLLGLGEAAATFGTGLAASVPAGMAGMAQMIPTRGRVPDVNKAAQTVEDVQGALTYLPRTPTGQRVLERGAGALGMLGVPAEMIGEKTLEYTGSPAAATAANVLLDPVNFIGMPGSGKATMAAAKGAGRAAAAAPRVAGEMLQDLVIGNASPGSMRAQRGAIKMKGGNWLAGEVEGATEPLRPRLLNEEGLRNLAARTGVENANAYKVEKAGEYALNNWIDKKLNRYIKNEMATPEDPVRKLAEQGVLHYTPETDAFLRNDANDRRQAGLTPLRFGSSPLARAWEDVSDLSVIPLQAEDWQKGGKGKILQENPWLEKVTPETDVYSMSSMETEKLGFSHLIDELKNSIRPDSDLPAHLRWKPEDLEKVTMEQAVRRVHDINEYRAAKKAEANEVLARNPATVTFKEYPTVPGSDAPNAKGLAWKEIKMPEAVLPEGYTARHLPEVDMWGIYDPKGGAEGMGATEREAMGLFRRDERKKSLEEALKYEGEVMGHCAKGYCDKVLSGKSKIYSLRDKKGEPHVTIEVERMPRRGFREGEGPKTQPEDQALRFDWLQDAKSGKIGDDVTFAEWWRAKNGIPEPGPEFQITQIKGKGNLAPKEEYLPFVQDFVRGGNWSRVGDFQNTGMRDMDRTPNLREWLKSKGIETPRYITEKEYSNYEGDFLLDRLGKKEGGSVHISDNPDTMALELATGGAVAAAKAAAKAAARSVEPSIVRPGNPIQGAVVLIGDQMFLGRTHTDALNRAIYEGVVRKENNRLVFPPGAEVDSDLFMTRDGRVIDRLTAFKEMDIGASESAIEKGLMQNAPARSMSVESYMDQARALRNKALQPAVSKQVGGAIKAAAKAAVKVSEKEAAKSKPVYPQAEALERARKNAVEMLGLPENNTAMDRAKALGFDLDTNYIHSTHRPFNSISETGRFPGVFTTPNYSSGYGSVDMPMVLRGSVANSRDLDAFTPAQARAAMMGKPSTKKARMAAREEIPSGATDPAEIADEFSDMQNLRMRLAREMKYPGVKMSDEFGDTVALLPGPAVRSRFAAFDPAEMNKPGLLKKNGGAVHKPENKKVAITDNLDTMRLAVQKRK